MSTPSNKYKTATDMPKYSKLKTIHSTDLVRNFPAIMTGVEINRQPLVIRRFNRIVGVLCPPEILEDLINDREKDIDFAANRKDSSQDNTE